MSPIAITIATFYPGLDNAHEEASGFLHLLEKMYLSFFQSTYKYNDFINKYISFSFYAIEYA